ncbi:uncharacterized protein [Miscanthus floridulus]|uniref:uncharacterized protein n=1 Tax=Miscanthus floridulus TaxID=154761 RepID=UPI0034579265
MAAADHLDTKASSDNTTAAGVRSSSVSADPFVLVSEAIVHRVWRENCDEAFKLVVDKLRQPRRHFYIALDIEFVAGASTNVRFRPICWNTWYDHLRTFVNGGEMLQVGLALAFDLDLDHQRHREAQAPSSVIALEINLRFDVDAREYNDASITFLAVQGHRLTEHRDRGVTMEQFLNGLLRHLPFGDDFVIWVPFHGDRDFGFLLLLLQQQGRGVLPPDRAAFMRQVRQQFPVFYDVRVLGQLEKEGFTGSLTALAAHLGVRRIGGEHHAGSDALLTLSCFKEIHRRNKHELHRLHSRQCLMSGMEELDMGIKCARHIDDATVTTVEVRGHNFNKEARLIDEVVTSNFKIVGADVQLLPLGCGIPFYAADPQQDYDLMKSSLKGINEFHVTVAFMNAEGMLAYGRVWKFHLSSRADPAVAGGNSAYVRPGQLAWLMASCGATHNPNVAWVTYQGSLGIACLIKSFLAADDLPSDWCSYIKHQRGVFPGLYDVRLIAQGCPDIAKAPLGVGDVAGAPGSFCFEMLQETGRESLFSTHCRGCPGAAYGESELFLVLTDSSLMEDRWYFSGTLH